MAGRSNNNGRELAARIRKVAKAVEAGAVRVHREAALIGDRTLVMATPVDTGRARSNTIVSSPDRDYRVLKPYAPTEQGGIGEQANAQGALKQAQEAVARHVPHEPIILQNNLGYFRQLDDGSSAQAPGGMSALALQAMRRHVRAQKLLDKVSIVSSEDFDE